MRFRQLDQIMEVKPGESLTAIRQVTGDEPYLRDHFPRFPVLPGVLMLEAMFQAAAWLVRVSDDFAHAAVFLKEARNVKYADFVAPGQELIITASIAKQDERFTSLKTQGTLDEKVAVSAKLVLERCHLADLSAGRAPADPWTRREMRREFERLCPFWT